MQYHALVGTASSDAGPVRRPHLDRVCGLWFVVWGLGSGVWGLGEIWGLTANARSPILQTLSPLSTSHSVIRSRPAHASMRLLVGEKCASITEPWWSVAMVWSNAPMRNAPVVRSQTQIVPLPLASLLPSAEKERDEIP